ncbi:hypothetical protein K432DRAFT_377433 [Lepidopterella palustris CBS 459.81]|uniref:Uncharacterized protein n=1 Tax=Lepidopterella palustris CBS 459.81 TaxID=1314670 RepID=A0A8E2EKI5_9PEZI|nr:hypothetical protein K432DRAFT_377433 [Lepidopterella palustris CBS 459.81]
MSPRGHRMDICISIDIPPSPNHTPSASVLLVRLPNSLSLPLSRLHPEANLHSDAPLPNLPPLPHPRHPRRLLRIPHLLPRRPRDSRLGPTQLGDSSREHRLIR